MILGTHSTQMYIYREILSSKISWLKVYIHWKRWLIWAWCCVLQLIDLCKHTHIGHAHEKNYKNQKDKIIFFFQGIQGFTICYGLFSSKRGYSHLVRKAASLIFGHSSMYISSSVVQFFPWIKTSCYKSHFQQGLCDTIKWAHRELLE